MDERKLEEKLNELELKLAGLQNPPKDRWDIFNIIASLLIPASIAFSGYYFSTAIKEAEIQSSEKLATRQENIALINSKVGQAELISAFLEPLTGDNEQKKRVAIRGILIALPEDGPQIVSAVSVSDPSSEIQQFARSELDLQREQLINRAFSQSKTTRIAATTELIRGWSKDEALVPELVRFASRNIDNKDGVINALVVLQNVDTHLLGEHTTMIEQFIDDAIPNGSRTAEHAAKLRKKLKASTT